MKGTENMTTTGLLARLARLNINATDLDDAIELSAQSEALRDGYKRHNMPTPAALDDGIRTLDRYIAEKARDVAEMELRELAAADAADMSAGERREARRRRKEELETRLGRKTPVTTT